MALEDTSHTLARTDGNREVPTAKKESLNHSMTAPSDISVVLIAQEISLMVLWGVGREGSRP